MQAEGRCTGYPFYFRTECKQWRFHVAYKPGAGIMAEGFNDEAGIVITGTWRQGIFQAGWTSHEVARQNIHMACCVFRAELRQRENYTGVDWKNEEGTDHD